MTSAKERAAFTLSGATKLKLENAIQKSKRSRFVEKAIEDALLVEAKIKALEALEKKPDIDAKGDTKEDTKGYDSIELLRRIRQNRNDELLARHQS
ncbi:MAG: hypothetical protein L3J32_05160 [Rhizobiaceae bacterium]|nr:hypothetical protein [Rhizobiaceae bacterium]